MGSSCLKIKSGDNQTIFLKYKLFFVLGQELQSIPQAHCSRSTQRIATGLILLLYHQNHHRHRDTLDHRHIHIHHILLIHQLTHLHHPHPRVHFLPPYPPHPPGPPPPPSCRRILSDQYRDVVGGEKKSIRIPINNDYSAYTVSTIELCFSAWYTTGISNIRFDTLVRKQSQWYKLLEYNSGNGGDSKNMTDVCFGDHGTQSFPTTNVSSPFTGLWKPYNNITSMITQYQVGGLYSRTVEIRMRAYNNLERTLRYECTFML